MGPEKTSSKSARQTVHISVCPGSHQTYDSRPVDSFRQQEGQVAHHVDDQRLNDPRLLRELQEEGSHAAHQGTNRLQEVKK
jgi:hypothetical protein